MEHHAGTCRGQVCRQLIQFRGAGDETGAGGGQVRERTCRNGCGLGNGRGRGVLDGDVDRSEGLEWRRLGLLWLARMTKQMVEKLAQQAKAGFDVLGLAQDHPGNHHDPEDNPTRRMSQQQA